MIPTHHPSDDWLFAYAAGTLCEAESLIVAAHATFCPTCRQELAALEEAAARRLAALLPIPVQDGALERLLAQLPEQDEPPAPPAGASGTPLPQAILQYLDATDAPPWRRLAPGVRQITLPIHHGEMPVRLMQFAPGSRVPAHGHAGKESTCVLQGGYSDERGDYVLGDVQQHDEGGVHRQRIHRGEPCIALLVAERPLVPVGVLSTVLSWFVSA